MSFTWRNKFYVIASPAVFTLNRGGSSNGEVQDLLFLYEVYGSNILTFPREFGPWT